MLNLNSIDKEDALEIIKELFSQMCASRRQLKPILTEILKAMGADNRLIQRIFMNEGLLISVAGGLIGLLLGIILVLLQQQFGFVKFGTGGNYVVDAYPVLLKLKDVLLIFATILVVGCTSAFLTVRHAMRKSSTQKSRLNDR